MLEVLVYYYSRCTTYMCTNQAITPTASSSSYYHQQMLKNEAMFKYDNLKLNSLVKLIDKLKKSYRDVKYS